MNKNTLINTALGISALLVLAGCQREYFDENKYQELIEVSFPISDIDPAQNWATAREVSVLVRLSTTDDYQVFFMTENPQQSSSACLLQHAMVSGSTLHSIDLCCPSLTSRLYVAVADKEGRVTSQSLTLSSGTNFHVDFTDAPASALTVAQMEALPHQPYTFCFDDAFPATGDWDFNDVVIAADLDKGYATDAEQPDTLIIRTTLRAVGTKNIMAAAIHLNGVLKDDVEPLFEAPQAYPFYAYNGNMVPDASDFRLAEMSTSDYSQYRHVCLPLFSDAHYAINGGLTDNNAMVTRYYYNTKLEEDMEDEPEDMKSGVVISPAKAEYRILFHRKSRSLLSSFNMMDLDLFTITGYNSGWFETHTYPYKVTQVFHEYISSLNMESYKRNIPWALLVAADFQYAKEGSPIGGYKGQSLTGAYNTPGHSFGEWGKSARDATDWYCYPNRFNAYH